MRAIRHRRVRETGVAKRGRRWISPIARRSFFPLMFFKRISDMYLEEYRQGRVGGDHVGSTSAR